MQQKISRIYARGDKIIKAVDLREKEKVINILNNYKVTGRECINALFICPKCNKLYENFHVRIIYKDIIKGKEFEIYADDDRQFQTEFFLHLQCTLLTNHHYFVFAR